MNMVFPSVEFFRALQTLMQGERERFKRLGYFDATIGVRVLDAPAGTQEYVLQFEVFDCTQTRDTTDLGNEATDFVLEGDFETWTEMLRNITTHGAADLAHGINTLTHLGERLRVLYDDPDGHDKLYRFAESVQEFFDLAGRLNIDFAASGAPVGAAGPHAARGI